MLRFSCTTLRIVAFLTLRCCASFRIETGRSLWILMDAAALGRLRRALCPILRRTTPLQVLEIVQTPQTVTVDLGNFKKCFISTGERPARNATMTAARWSYCKAIFYEIVHCATSVHMCFLQIFTGFECSSEKQYNSIITKFPFISSLLLKYLLTINLNRLSLRNMDLEALLD